MGKINLVKILQPKVHTKLKDARFLLVTSKYMPHFSQISAYIGHGDLVSFGHFEII